MITGEPLIKGPSEKGTASHKGHVLHNVPKVAIPIVMTPPRRGLQWTCPKVFLLEVSWNRSLTNNGLKMLWKTHVPLLYKQKMLVILNSMKSSMYQNVRHIHTYIHTHSHFSAVWGKLRLILSILPSHTYTKPLLSTASPTG